MSIDRKQRNTGTAVAFMTVAMFYSITKLTLERLEVMQKSKDISRAADFKVVILFSLAGVAASAYLVHLLSDDLKIIDQFLR
jgi:hypothetical protein